MTHASLSASLRLCYPGGGADLDIERMPGWAEELSKRLTNTLFIAAGLFRRISVLWLTMNLQSFLGIEFGDQFLGRRQAICANQDRFDFCPIDLRRI